MIDLKSYKVLIAIPCYNEEVSLQNTLTSIKNEMKKYKNFKILLVNDGSSDNSAKIANDLNIEVLNHNSNLGLGKTFQSAVNFALENQFEYLLTIDADGQFDSGQIHEFIKNIILSKADLVTGSRFLSKSKVSNMPAIRKLGNIIYARIINLICGRKLTDVSCGFRVYSREALFNLNLTGKFTYTHETIITLSMLNKKIVEIPVNVMYFDNRNSKISGSLLRYAIETFKIIFNTLTNFQPAKIFLITGSLNLVISIFFGYDFFSNKLRTGSFTGHYYAGVLCGFFGILAAISCLVTFESLVLSKIQGNQRDILYQQKKIMYKKGA